MEGTTADRIDRVRSCDDCLPLHQSPAPHTDAAFLDRRGHIPTVKSSTLNVGIKLPPLLSMIVILEVDMQFSLFPEAEFTAHKSGQDASVNWDRPVAIGRLEARYVRRSTDYFVVYLSSQTGCAQGCRMCHLTATGQTRLRDTTIAEMIDQAEIVLDHYRRHAQPARSVHFNFMARGEPLANRAFLSDADGLLDELSRRAIALGLRPSHLV